MTSRADPRFESMDVLFVERALESYAEATRIVATDQFRERVRVRLADEPRLTPWRRTWYAIQTSVQTAFGRDPVAATARLHALVLLLVCALALALAVGGAGAVLVTRMSGPAHETRQSSEHNVVLPLPTETTPSHSNPTASPRPTNSATPRAGQAGAKGAAPRRTHGVTHGHAASGSGSASRKTAKPRLRHAASPTPTRTPPPKPSPAPSDNGGGSPAPSPTVSATATSSPTPMPTPTSTATPAATETATPDPTPKVTPTPQPTTEPTAAPSEAVAKPRAGTPTDEPRPNLTPAPSQRTRAGA